MKSQILRTALGLGGALFFLFSGTAPAATVTVQVGTMYESGSRVKKDAYVDPLLIFTPASVTIKPGDTVLWIWDANLHSTTSGTPGSPSGFWDSGVLNSGATFAHVFPNLGTFSYYCSTHGNCCQMIGTVFVVASTPTPSPSPSPSPRPASQAQLLNISTRMQVQTGESVLIGGFIVTGNVAKEVILRAIGPSLTSQGVTGALADPVLELHASDGALITSNDNWKTTQQTEIEATGVAPQNDLESAIIATLNPAAYTAIVSGKNATSGVGLVEGYDLDQPADAQLANISTRGFVETGSNVMIGGFILGNGTGTTNVLIRALGPSLTGQGVAGALADPTLELRDSNGALVQSNDNWKASQQADIEATGAPPINDLESAMVVTIPTGAYTAIVVGTNGGTGVGLVELYRLP
jgi:plastocyanin